MGFLQRSKSAAVVETTQRGKKVEAELQPDMATSNTFNRQVQSHDRPKTADDRRSRSFSRPRTATGVSRKSERSFEADIPPPTMDFRAGDQTFMFPTPSPRLPPKSATFQAQQSNHSHSGSPQIGVALGSPSQPPPMPTWGRSYTADHVSGRMPAQAPPNRAPPAIPEPLDANEHQIGSRKKTSSWKSFGGMFGRGRKPPRKIEEPFYSLKVQPHSDQPSEYRVVPETEVRRLSPARPPHVQRPSTYGPSFEGPRQLKMQRMPMTRGMARLEARAEATLASLGPAEKSTVMPLAQKDGFSPMFRALNECRESEEFFRTAGAERNDSPLSMNEKLDDHVAAPRTPRLDLAIPDPKFERYSVMFEKLLEEPKMSLLERRQSKLQRRKSVKTLDTVSSVEEEPVPATEDANTMPQRSLKSPGLKKALSIKIGKNAAIHRPRPVQRSNTAPPNAQSPLERSFSRAKAALRTLSPRSPAFPDGGPPTTPLTAATFSDADSIAIINNDVGRHQRSMDQAEPAWDMMTSEAASGSPDKVMNPYRRVKSPADLERNIVQVSVARQVSVNKAREQVQRSVVCKQPLRPRVVELSKDKDRKSTVVLIEEGDD